ncbi:hypothetical protein M9H77_13022 [Catharanthus roseus]|uniref:Uncharacterized protein n=1 Tax=Catharanthus roseus TaxID=4058 RepID=A0ACC0BJ81_CATRO|nr:hypothetical protein M9H77_13022 [Catharanthus roseus]
MDPLEERRSTLRAFPNRYLRRHHVLRWDGRLVESQEGLETEVGPRADLDGQRYNKLLRFYARRFGSSLSKKTYVSVLLSCTRAVSKFSAERRADTLISRAALYASPSTGIRATNSSASDRDASPFCVLKTVQN